VIDVTEASFASDVLEASNEQPVVVDFWADWCGPCRTLGPVLERLAVEAAGRWVLAKVDVDSNPALAQAAGVQGIPAVRAFRDGKQVAEFTGALPEDSVRRWLGGLGPGPAETALELGRSAAARGDAASAAEAFRDALEAEPGHPSARRELATAELALRAAALRAASLDEGELSRRAASHPLDIEAVLGIADLEAARGDLDSAFERLLAAVAATSDGDRERLRTHLLRLLDTIPLDDLRALKGRRGLAAALY